MRRVGRTRHFFEYADVVVAARSERASFHGPGDDDEYLQQDVVYKALDVTGRAAVEFDGLESDLQDVIRGYADGYNAYLDETGAENIEGWCQGEP